MKNNNTLILDFPVYIKNSIVNLVNFSNAAYKFLPFQWSFKKKKEKSLDKKLHS